MSKGRLKYIETEGLSIICNKCKKTIHRDYSTKNGCAHEIQFQKYKATVILPGSGKKRKTKNLDSRNIDDAIRELMAFRSVYNKTDLNKRITSQLLVDNFAKFSDYMFDNGVPEHQKKHNSEKYIKTTLAYVKEFLNYLKINGYNLSLLSVKSINDKEVGNYFAFLLNKNVGNSSFNASIKALSLFWKFMIKNERINIENHWQGISKRPVRPTNKSFSYEDYCDLIEVIDMNEPLVQVGKKKRSMYRPWLVNCIKLKMFTGQRHEEIVNLTWQMIKEENGEMNYIAIPNLKINRLKNLFRLEEMEQTFIPISQELKELLIELGYERQKNSTDFILPSTESRLDMVDKMGKCFAHFWKKLNRPYKLSLKHCRHTYITALSPYLSSHSLNHSQLKITEINYIDNKVIASHLTKIGFRVFQNY